MGRGGKTSRRRPREQNPPNRDSRPARLENQSAKRSSREARAGAKRSLVDSSSIGKKGSGEVGSFGARPPSWPCGAWVGPKNQPFPTAGPPQSAKFAKMGYLVYSSDACMLCSWVGSLDTRSLNRTLVGRWSQLNTPFREIPRISHGTSRKIFPVFSTHLARQGKTTPNRCAILRAVNQSKHKRSWTNKNKANWTLQEPKNPQTLTFPVENCTFHSSPLK